jgi:isocitrate/isopropylmalate dehydrogenase
MGAIERTLEAGDLMPRDLGGSATTAQITARICDLLRGANV